MEEEKKNKNKNPAVASLLGIETKKKEEADEKMKEKTTFSFFSVKYVTTNPAIMSGMHHDCTDLYLL